MAKATHNGICQVCGALQAVNPKTGNLANHGYSVMWHSQHGTCPGSRQLPIQVSSDLAEKTAKGLEAKMNQLRHDVEHEEITKVKVTRRGPWGREELMVTREEFKDPSDFAWAEACQRTLREMTFRADLYEECVKQIKSRIEKYHGQSLIQRDQEAA